VPAGCRDALDVGCGDGLPARKLADRVTGVDSSLDFDAALGRMRDLLRPGGVLMVVGSAREPGFAEGDDRRRPDRAHGEDPAPRLQPGRHAGRAAADELPRGPHERRTAPARRPVPPPPCCAGIRSSG
jgi:SAM-dependent methyltransferase